jgi:phospholipase/carboxylesterase
MEQVGQLGPVLLRALAAFEQVQRRLHPPAIPELRSLLVPYREKLSESHATFQTAAVPDGLETFATQMGDCASQTEQALALFCDPAPDGDGIGRVMAAMRAHTRALALLYPLRHAVPPFGRFFVESDCDDRLAELDPENADGARVGIHRAHNAPEQRGGFHLYVPESCSGDEPLPLVVALHGGSGHGADFLWTWLREAKSRRCILLAPTSQGPTWSLMGPDLDAKPLYSMIEFIAARWPIDREHMLLTGLSDGATYTLLCGLREDSPFTALAPISGVLHPANLGNGNLARANGRPIYLVHGTLDWMFPIDLARMAAEQLRQAGAQLVFREIEDLSHTYPREINSDLLAWLDPALAPRGA